MTTTAPPTTLAQTTVEPADPDPCLAGNYVTFDAENERSPLYVKPSSEPWLCDRCARACVIHGQAVSPQNPNLTINNLNYSIVLAGTSM